MNISILDGSNYFKGLLLLIRKDYKITDSEIEVMKRVGKTLGFEKEFYTNAIRDVLENEYIVDTPPEFSSKELAVKFIKDGLSLSFSDNELHSSEEAWLISTAEKNGLDANWFYQERENITNKKERSTIMEVDNLSIQYF